MNLSRTRHACVRTVCMLCACAALASCQKNDPAVDESADLRSRQSREDIAFIASLGYDTEDIEKTGDGYLVEGDIWLTDAWLEDARSQPGTRLTQHHAGNLVGQTYQNKLFLNLSNLSIVSALWNNPATVAANQWNALANCYINIGFGTSGDAEIKIQFADRSAFGNSTAKLMKVTPPSSSGKPGSVVLNRDCSFLPNVNDINNATQQNRAMYLIMHAIGHTLGLGHTLKTGQSDNNDDDWGATIGGSAGYDDKSIMVRETNPLPWSGFSVYDKVFIPVIFPLPSLNGGSIPETKTIDQTDGVFSIASLTDASGGAGTIGYTWEKKSGQNWTKLSGQTGKNLTNAPVPKELTSEYRRKATNGSKSAYSNVCTVTNSKYNPLEPGKIELLRIEIDTENPNDPLTIRSVLPASCPRDGVTYSWEIGSGDTWTVIPGASEAALTTTAPMAFATTYRRKATCAHESGYSNMCTVYNRAFFTGGTIEERIEINRTSFSAYLDIKGLTPGCYPESAYKWETDAGNGWVGISMYEEELAYYTTPLQHLTKFRRVIETPLGAAYSNECTVVNYAYREDPRVGTDFEEHVVRLGPYDSGFEATEIFDTRGEYFEDLDRALNYGNDACLELILDRGMWVDFLTGSPVMGVVLAVWSDEEMKYTVEYETGFLPYGPGDGFPSFENPDEFATVIPRYLNPGRYRINIQGKKVSNAGVVNHLLGISMHGYLGPQPPLSESEAKR